MISSSKASLSKGKEKDKGSCHVKNSVREVYASDSDRFQKVDSDEESSLDSSEEDTPKLKQKNKSASKKKTQKVNHMVFSDDEDFLQGPM